MGKKKQSAGEESTQSERLSTLFAQLRAVTDEIEQVTLQGAVDSVSAGNDSEKQSSTGLRKRRIEQVVAKVAALEEVHEEHSRRPKLYPHTPMARRDKLEQAGFEDLVLMDALKIREFDGIYNLAMFMLGFAFAYNALRSVMEKGLQLDLEHMTCPSAVVGLRTTVITTLTSVAWAYASYFVVKFYVVYRSIPFIAFAVAYVVAQFVLIVGPTAFVWMTPMSPVHAMVCEAVVLVLALKSHSYVATNYALLRESAWKDEMSHVGLLDYSYFLAAPTLVYETAYPRAKSTNWRYVAKKTAQMALSFAGMYAITAQFLLPVLQRPTTALWYDMLKLAMPSFVMWLLGFYAFFHCWLNIVAEILRFADRLFFLDWWNSTSLDRFWALWNLPIHEFCLRHLFVESQVYFGISKATGTLYVFLISALLHELVASVAFKTIRPWFFFGMLAQVPLIWVSRMFRGHRRGNLIVWISLFSGQPLLEMLYFKDWFARYDSFFCA